MRILALATMTAACLTLAACGGQGDDRLGDQAQEAAENRADAIDATADTMTGAAEDATEARADAVRAAGEAKEEAIDDADVNADAMTNAQREAIIDGN